MSNKMSINVKLCALSVKCLTLNSMINLEKAFSFYHCLTNALTVSHIYISCCDETCTELAMTVALNRYGHTVAIINFL